jgi:hypothetical protein
MLKQTVVGHPVCREPDNIEQILADYQASDHMSFIMPPRLRAEMDRQNKFQATQASSSVYDVQEQLIYGQKQCPEMLASGIDSPLEDRSTCPFYYVISHDPRRFPAAIAQARCKCRSCLDVAGGKSANVCEPFYYPMKVLMKTGCVDGVYQYEDATIQIQVGCMCAHRRMAVSGSGQQAENDSVPTSATGNDGGSNAGDAPLI